MASLARCQRNLCYWDSFTPCGDGDQFGGVVAADQCWSRAEAGELLKHRFVRSDFQVHIGDLVDQVQHLQPATIGCVVALEP